MWTILLYCCTFFDVVNSIHLSFYVFTKGHRDYFLGCHLFASECMLLHSPTSLPLTSSLYMYVCYNCCCFVAVSARHAGRRDQNVAGSKHRLWSGPNEDPVSGQLGCQPGITVEFRANGLVQNCQHRAAVSTVWCTRLLPTFVIVL